MPTIITKKAKTTGASKKAASSTKATIPATVSIPDPFDTKAYAFARIMSEFASFLAENADVITRREDVQFSIAQPVVEDIKSGSIKRSGTTTEHPPSAAQYAEIGWAIKEIGKLQKTVFEVRAGNFTASVYERIEERVDHFRSIVENFKASTLPANVARLTALTTAFRHLEEQFDTLPYPEAAESPRKTSKKEEEHEPRFKVYSGELHTPTEDEAFNAFASSVFNTPEDDDEKAMRVAKEWVKEYDVKPNTLKRWAKLFMDYSIRARKGDNILEELVDYILYEWDWNE